jgi:hypothetical protein
MIEGRWMIEGAEMGGAPMPMNELSGSVMVISGDRYDVAGVDKGRLVAHGGDRWDVIGEEGPNAGKTMPARFRLAGGKLEGVYGMDGSVPAGFDTTGCASTLKIVFRPG